MAAADSWRGEVSMTLKGGLVEGICGRKVNLKDGNNKPFLVGSSGINITMSPQVLYYEL